MKKYRRATIVLQLFVFFLHYYHLLDGSLTNKALVDIRLRPHAAIWRTQ